MEQSPKASGGAHGVDASLVDALTSAKLQLETSLGNLIARRPALEAIVAKRRFMGDDNTGCNNTSCGAAAQLAAPVIKQQ